MSLINTFHHLDDFSLEQTPTTEGSDLASNSRLQMYFRMPRIVTSLLDAREIKFDREAVIDRSLTVSLWMAAVDDAIDECGAEPNRILRAILACNPLSSEDVGSHPYAADLSNQLMTMKIDNRREFNFELTELARSVEEKSRSHSLVELLAWTKKEGAHSGNLVTSVIRGFAEVDETFQSLFSRVGILAGLSDVFLDIYEDRKSGLVSYPAIPFEKTQIGIQALYESTRLVRDFPEVINALPEIGGGLVAHFLKKMRSKNA